MLLNYNKPVQVSSTFGSYEPNNAVDESIKTYWCAKTSNAGEWIQSDLGNVSTVNAIQVNYADQDADILVSAPICIINTKYILLLMEIRGIFWLTKATTIQMFRTIM
jgi:hypothetical protein